MKRNANQFILSPSDLVRYMHPLFVFQMLWLGLEFSQMRQFKDKPDVLLMQLPRRGLQHESEYLETLEQSSKTFIAIKNAFGNSAKIIYIIKAIKGGSDFIFQACLNSNDNCHFQGHCEFLLNCERSAKPSIKTNIKANSPTVLEYQVDTSQEFRGRRFRSANVLGNCLLSSLSLWRELARLICFKDRRHRL